MASFASFRKCDFQIHSCRDPNWEGQRPLGVGDAKPGGAKASAVDVEASRKAWAKSLVDKCVAKKLRAIALTDHHEMVMVRYVLEEVQTRRSAGADPDLWVFPGMELTLQGGCQCLILFDAELEPRWWVQAKGTLGINHAAIDEHTAKGASVTQLSYPYVEIASRLDAIKGLKGRYIVLPNVSGGGQYTVVTEGEHKNFREMPYVGGYLDKGQNIDNIPPRLKNRLSGKDNVWGDKYIYPLPTTDSREAGYPRLGTNETWIKISAPTAESIRQAFLGCNSRISLEAPAYPSIVVKSIKVKGTDPLADIDLEFSPEFNTVIGGRGSGKSTLLEYIAFGLGRSCFDLSEKPYSGLARLTDLIKETVIAKGGEVTLVVTQDGADFEIKRAATTRFEPQVKYPNGKKETLSAKELRSLFPAIAYSQGELSELGREARDKTSVDDLLTFIRAPYKVEADEAETAIRRAKDGMAKVARDFSQLWTLTAEKTKAENQLAAATARIAALQATLTKLQEGDQAVLDKNQAVIDIGQQAERQQADIEELQELVEDLSGRLASAQRLRSTLPDAVVSEVKTSTDKVLSQVGTKLDALSKELTAGLKGLAPSYKKLEKFVADHKKTHDGIVSKIGTQRTVAKQIAELQKACATEKDKISQLGKKISALGDLNKRYRDARTALRKSVEDQAEGYKKWASQIEDLSGGSVSIDIDEDGDLSDIYVALDTLAVRTYSQEAARNKKLNERISADGAWNTLDKLSSEVGSLLGWKLGADGEKAKGVPDYSTVSSILGESDTTKRATADMVDEARYLSVVQAAPKPQVTFKYKADGQEIAFEKASEGQRAAVLLTMLLKQEGGPLIIDQPESDLDNSVISKVVDLLHTMKNRRQLFFATHNANLVVNGSAELVAYMANSSSGKRIIEHCGAIDHPPLRLAITNTMEGGETAFKDRQRKYGF
ncbi:TrlF family AAA-like ATPase [Bradyrhizobium glycinis]|uniref:TrlF family AAA-like ATPase n=1 Tax=Bradyrhizobium glycinis TaxID=2751812 RepID=UPI0035DFB6B4